jgi:hypothetical protein
MNDISCAHQFYEEGEQSFAGQLVALKSSLAGPSCTAEHNQLTHDAKRTTVGVWLHGA